MDNRAKRRVRLTTLVVLAVVLLSAGISRLLNRQAEHAWEEEWQSMFDSTNEVHVIKYVSQADPVRLLFVNVLKPDAPSEASESWLSFDRVVAPNNPEYTLIIEMINELKAFNWPWPNRGGPSMRVGFDLNSLNKGTIKFVQDSKNIGMTEIYLHESRVAFVVSNGDVVFRGMFQSPAFEEIVDMFTGEGE